MSATAAPVRVNQFPSRTSFTAALPQPLRRRLIDGKVVARGERGELCTRGYSVMHGYWNEPEKTADSIDSGGWMHTGDLAVIDDEGYCNIVGRVKDMIIRG
ncbi:MAG: AMP-binding protein, partial [Rhodospirillaceae bacterium]|nr:AMP-binding protein [Rhodospirillaceae bacterium]